MNKKILQLLSLTIVALMIASCSSEDELTNLITDTAYTPVSITVAKGSTDERANTAANGPQRIEYHYDEAQSNPLWATWEQDDELYVCYNNNVNKLTISEIKQEKNTATFTGLIKGNVKNGETLYCVAGDKNQVNDEIITVKGDGTFEYNDNPFLNQDATVGGAGKLNVYTCTNAKYKDGKIIASDNSMIVTLSPKVSIVKFEIKYPLGIDNDENATLTYKSKSGDTETEIVKVAYTTEVNDEKAQDIFIAFPAQAFSDKQTLVLNIGDKKYSKTLSSNGVIFAEGYVYRKEINFAPNNNDYPYVDLCLPSGNLWAKTNIGAEKETDWGLYFAWGETQGYNPPVDQHKFNAAEYQYRTTVSSLGSDISGTKYDAATANWNGDWVMPNADDFIELKTNTTYEWIEDFEGTGVKGVKFTSKCTGSNEYIFLPATGRWRDGIFYKVGYDYGEYYSSIVNPNYTSSNAWTFIVADPHYQYGDPVSTSGVFFRSGLNIRPVIRVTD